MEDRRSSLLSKYSTHLAGGAAGAVAAIFTCPFDVMKTRLQVQSIHTSSIYHDGLIGMIKTMYHNEGIRGFFAGLSPTMLGLVPTYAIYFTTYTNFKTYFCRKGFEEGPLLHIFSAVSAGMLTDICTNPLWVIKTRLQTQIMRPHMGRYKGILDCFRRMLREEGVRSFYKGLVPQLMGIVHVAIQFPVYERMKLEMKKMNDKGTLSVSQLMFAAASSKMIAAVGAYPHEVLRSNLQIQSRGDEKVYGEVINMFKRILREEGLKGLYKGLTPNLLKVIPATAISFTTFEMMCSYLSNL